MSDSPKHNVPECPSRESGGSGSGKTSQPPKGPHVDPVLKHSHDSDERYYPERDLNEGRRDGRG